MNYKKKTKIAVLITAVLTVFITGSAFAFGANVPDRLQNLNPRSVSKDVLPSVIEDTKSIFTTYYSAQSTRVFEMFKKKIFANLVDDWTAEIDGIENPVWNYDSFAGYQYLDHTMLSVSRYEELYYCTFSADNDKSGYVVMSYDGSSLQKISAVETPYLYDLQANIDKIADRLKNRDLSSVKASRVKWVDTDKNRSDDVIVFTDDNSKNYIYYFDDAALIIPGAVDAAHTIDLAELRQLATKGYALTFEDFSGYEGKDVGSGLYILYFNIDGGYTLYVGGGSPTGKPFYAFLGIPGVEERIDIRYADIDEFIGKYPVPNELGNRIYEYLDTIMSSPSLSSATGDYIEAHMDEYAAICNMGETALPTLTGILNAGDMSLRGNIAALLVQDIIISKSDKPRSEWLDGVLQSAALDVERWSRGFSPNDIPATRK